MILFIRLHSTAQTLDGYTKAIDILPPPPNATAIVKHNQININKNTGAPNIDIPLFPIKGIKLQLGMSLNYASNGIKVDEISSRVGMGWSIQAGGVVTRTVRGEVDELNPRLTPPATFTSDGATYNYLSYATMGSPDGDTEPDLFTFNVAGLSGSFMLDENMQPTLLSSQKCKIEMNLTSSDWNFKVTNTEGIAYYFGGSAATEKTKRESSCGDRNHSAYVPVSWYLIKIQHPNGEYINLAYTPITYTYDTGSSESQMWGNPLVDYTGVYSNGNTVVSCSSCPVAIPRSTCITHVNTQGVLLYSITSSTNNSATFSYGSRTDCNDQLVSQISYAGPDGSMGNFQLNYVTQQANLNYANLTYTGYDKTPYLTSLSEYSSNNTLVKKHLFTYNDPASRPPRLSYSQDHWGYFNGQNNYNTFIPMPATADLRAKFPLATANREAHEGYAAKGMLCKIQYPTGGIDTLTYENNRATAAALTPTHVLYGQATGTGAHTAVSINYSFYVPFDQAVQLTVHADTSDTIDPLHNLGLVQIYNSSGYFLNVQVPPRQGQINNMSIDLSAGSYTMMVQADGSIINTNASLTYKATAPQTSTLTDQPVGGVRIKSIITSASGQPAQVHTYYYGQLASMNLSSLVNVPQPVYALDTRSGLTCQVQSGAGTGISQATETCHGMAMHSSSLRNLYDFGGAPISYASVIESIGNNFEGGGTQTKFLTEADAPGQILYGHDLLNATQSNFSNYFNGKLKEETSFKADASGNIIPLKTQLYTYNADTANQKTFYGYVVQKEYSPAEAYVVPVDPNTSVLDVTMYPFSVVRYQTMSTWVYNDTVTTKIFDKTGQNPVISKTVYAYENPANRQLTKTASTTSDGHWKSEVRKYPHDYAGTSVYDSMIAMNDISPVVDIGNYKDATKLSEEKMNFSDWGNGNINLASVQTAYLNGSLVGVGTIEAYNVNGNITQYTGADHVTTAIIWGGPYGQYPVAKVVGSTYANAVSHLGVSDVSLYGMTEQNTRAQIDLIRTALPQAHVTTYTYKQKAGVSSITSDRKDISTYAYNIQDELGAIFDRDSYIVKKFDYSFDIPTPANTSGYYTNDYMQAAFTCQTCTTGYIAVPINYGIAANTYFSGKSKADANAAATVALNTLGQMYANQYATCTKNAPVYYNAAQSMVFTKNDCGANYTGSAVTMTVAAHTYSGPSQVDADYQATTYLNTNGQAYANANGTCTPNCNSTNCTGVDKKCINGACETGTKVYTSSVQDHGALWTCTFHYHWSDNSISEDYTETSSTRCMNEEQ